MFTETRPAPVTLQGPEVLDLMSLPLRKKRKGKKRSEEVKWLPVLVIRVFGTDRF